MHSFHSILVHCVGSTKIREPVLTPQIRARLWPYLGGVAVENDIKAIVIGGVADHVHMLASLPAKLSTAKALQLLKGNSSKWIHETFPGLRSFAWQEGYGAFSISISGLEQTVQYIRNQEKHHQTPTFGDEFVAMLKKHGLEFDKRMLSLVFRPWRDLIPPVPSIPQR